jgi:hypothetical protein
MAKLWFSRPSNWATLEPPTDPEAAAVPILSSDPADEGKLLDAYTGDPVVPGGGSSGGRLVDCGTVTVDDLAAGAVTLYEWQSGEIVGPLILRDPEFTDGSGVIRLGGALPGTQIALIDNDIIAEGMDLARKGWAGAQDGANPGGLGFTPTLQEDLLASLGAAFGYAPANVWQAGHAYPNFSAVIGGGHIWTTDVGGTSGGSEPDFAGSLGPGFVADNDITWNDAYEITHVGGVHVYAWVSTPVAA